MLIEEATVLGIVSLVGFGLTWTRIPRWVREFCVDHPLLTDGVLTYSAYEIAGGSLRGIIAAGIVSVIVSVLLYYATIKRRRQTRKQEGH